jgi:DNA-binding transcriptional LysR family regulator
MREELLLVTHPSHRVARQRKVRARELDGQPLVLFERGSSTRRVIDAMLAREGITPTIVMETENVEILKALVAIGMGMAIIPYQAVAREVRAGQLWCTRLDGVSMVRETGWVYMRAPRVPRLVQEMFEALERTLPRLKLAPPGRR